MTEGMSRFPFVATVALAVLVPAASGSPQDRPGSTVRPADPFSFFAPPLQISKDQRRQLEAGKVVAAALPAEDHELAIFAAGAIDIDGDVLIEKVNHIVQLEKGPMVPQVGRFSEPPRLEDLSTLSLDEVDLESIKRCRPRDCAVKLSTAEIERLRQAIAEAGRNWRDATLEEFRRIVLERVTAYLAHGESGIPAFSDNGVDLNATFLTLMHHSPYLQSKMPQLAAAVERYPAVKPPGVESFLYWSKEKPWRNPIISVTQVQITRGDPSNGYP
jgi:hypothetical protein